MLPVVVVMPHGTARLDPLINSRFVGMEAVDDISKFDGWMAKVGIGNSIPNSIILCA